MNTDTRAPVQNYYGKKGRTGDEVTSRTYYNRGRVETRSTGQEVFVPHTPVKKTNVGPVPIRPNGLY